MIDRADTRVAIEAALPSRAPAGTEEIAAFLDLHRRELTGYCYRMLGSAFEAEDAVQETLVRAWRGLDRFEGRASINTWLHRIATNVCLDMLNGAQRRARPIDRGLAGRADLPLGDQLAEATWIWPIPDSRAAPDGGDPAEAAIARETLRLAFVAALQHLPPRQRAVLILREVLDWRASEVAELLETSVPAVNSALQRARATLAARQPQSTASAAVPEDQQQLLERYVAAFEQYDLDALTLLLREDATWSMPPFAMWLRGPREISAFCLGPGIACRGSRLIATLANGSPAYGQYKPTADGGYEPWALQVVELAGERIAGVTFFLDTVRLFPLFGLPPRLEAEPRLDRQDRGQSG